MLQFIWRVRWNECFVWTHVCVTVLTSSLTDKSFVISFNNPRIALFEFWPIWPLTYEQIYPYETNQKDNNPLVRQERIKGNWPTTTTTTTKWRLAFFVSNEIKKILFLLKCSDYLVRFERVPSATGTGFGLAG